MKCVFNLNIRRNTNNLFLTTNSQLFISFEMRKEKKSVSQKQKKNKRQGRNKRWGHHAIVELYLNLVLFE